MQKPHLRAGEMFSSSGISGLSNPEELSKTLDKSMESWDTVFNQALEADPKAREQFELSSYKRLLDIYSSTAKTIDALMKLELPSGVEVEIKV